jgi:hypothetical protein
LLGPYVSYSALNLANDNGASMHVMSVGIKYMAVLL